MDRSFKLSKQEVFEMSYDQLQPTQLFISKTKLKSIYQWLNEKNKYKYDPIPVKRLKDKVIMVDVHTRAFALYQLGFKELQVVWEPEEWDWEAYQICVDWSIDESIYDVSCLENRLLDDEDYERLWHDRCREMQESLEEKR